MFPDTTLLIYPDTTLWSSLTLHYDLPWHYTRIFPDTSLWCSLTLHYDLPWHFTMIFPDTSLWSTLTLHYDLPWHYTMIFLPLHYWFSLTLDPWSSLTLHQDLPWHYTMIFPDTTLIFNDTTQVLIPFSTERWGYSQFSNLWTCCIERFSFSLQHFPFFLSWSIPKHNEKQHPDDGHL